MENIQKRIGIIGGGQLGKMMALAAKKMGFTLTVLDPTPDCPASSIVDGHIIAKFDDEAAIRHLAAQSDVVTYEFEHIGAKILEVLEQEGAVVYPTARSLRVIQNKLDQKTELQNGGIAVPAFQKAQTLSDFYRAGEQFGYPLVMKACTGGYDGKGNYIAKEKAEVEKGYLCLGAGNQPLMAEAFCPFVMEISVLACRAITGETAIYPVAENIHKDSILFETRVPAAISKQTADKAMALAQRVMEIFAGVGMFCVELFVDKEGEVLVNEVAPRPHNSGHYTIEGCMTSQFEQHVRAITGLPLGAPTLLCPVVMRNILGEGESGEAVVRGAEEALRVPGAYLHVYGKRVCSPKRKMGHITVVDENLANAQAKAEMAWRPIKIIGGDKK